MISRLHGLLDGAVKAVPVPQGRLPATDANPAAEVLLLIGGYVVVTYMFGSGCGVCRW